MLLQKDFFRDQFCVHLGETCRKRYNSSSNNYTQNNIRKKRNVRDIQFYFTEVPCLFEYAERREGCEERTANWVKRQEGDDGNGESDFERINWQKLLQFPPSHCSLSAISIYCTHTIIRKTRSLSGENDEYANLGKLNIYFTPLKGVLRNPELYAEFSNYRAQIFI